MVEYKCITVPESVHIGDPAGHYMELVMARNSARGHLMAWHDKQTLQEYLKELEMGSNLKRKEYSSRMSSEANETGLELLNKTSWRTALQKYFDESMRLVWCLVGKRK